MALVKLSPVFNAQIIDENGNPANGWKINTYIAGTSTPAVTYTDSTGLVAQSNPIIINSLGFTQNGQIWLVSGVVYKLVLTDALGVVKKTEDGISGVNDNAAAASEWGDIAIPTYISPNSYSLPGDQTSEYHIGRREKLTTNVGTVYGRIISSVFSVTITTVTLQMDGTQVLDIGLSSVQNSILRNNVLSLPERIATTSGTNAYTATVGTTRLVLGDEYKLNFAIANDGSVAPTLNIDGLGARALLLQNSVVPIAGQINGEHKIRDTTAGFIVLNPNIVLPPITVRQTINSAPVDANGFTVLGGATGATAITTTAISTTAPLVVNAAAGSTAIGGLGDRIGYSITNLTWTGLNINGTMQLSVDVAANGALTTTAGILLTNYQQGGTFSIVNGQHTFNIGVMNQTVGNGAAAIQSYRVAIGEVTVAGGVVTAITWYTLNSNYDSGFTATLPAAGVTTIKNHNLGLTPRGANFIAECTTINANYSVGDQIIVGMAATDSVRTVTVVGVSRSTIFIVPGSSGAFVALNKSTGVGETLVNANWKWKLISQRGW